MCCSCIANRRKMNIHMQNSAAGGDWDPGHPGVGLKQKGRKKKGRESEPNSKIKRSAN